MTRTIGWSFFLAMSWTWCIGMYLPVLLLRDAGWAGFAVFAIPNVVGAAAMGWMLRDAQQSRELVANHESACIWFSLVTIVFHAFFAAWIIRRIVGPSAGVMVGAAFAIFWLILQWERGGKFLAAVLVLAVSVFAFAWGCARGEIPYVAQPLGFSPTTLSPGGALWLAPACLFGFLLCPYLDLTFHAARQGTTAPQARAAFTAGFCLIFPLMILFSAAYSGPLVLFLARRIYPQLAAIVAVHLIAHSGFVAAAHARQLADRASRITLGRIVIFGAAVAAAVALGVWDRGYSYRGLRLGEIVYRCFLGFYALVFPAYVWLRVVPRRRSGLRLALAVLAAAPMFWLGFVERLGVWLLPGVLIPVAAKWIFTPRPGEPRADLPPVHWPPAGETGT